MNKRLLFCVWVCFLLLPAAAWAQQTGSVSGAVFDRGGNPVAGATVRITGEPLPGERTTVTSEAGMYSFLELLPGTYKVEVQKTGVGKMSRAVVVAVSRDTQNDFILGAQVSEELTVTAKTPEVDLKSTEVNFNYNRDFIQDLPLDRSYMGLTQLIPGIAENGAFAPNGGGSRQDNTYLIDTVNITNPLFGYLATEVNELDIAEVNAKRGAISAEFGRSTGFVTNAVTKSGTNTFIGNYRFEAIPNEWIAASGVGVARTATDRWVNSFGVGGPIKKNQLFFYASGRVFRSRSHNASNLLGPVPDSVSTSKEGFGKITTRIGPKQLLHVGYRHRPSKAVAGNVGTADTPSVATNTEGTNRVANVNYDLFVNNRLSVSVKYVHMDEQSEAVAVTDLGFQPLPFNVSSPATMGFYTTGGINTGAASLRLNRQNYHRDEFKATITEFFDVGKTSHQIKAGFGADVGVEDLTRNSNGWGTVGRAVVSGVTYLQGVYYPTQPSQLGIGRTYSLFVQDNITLHSRLTINAGVLVTRDEFAQKLDRNNTFLTFGFGDEVQPRIGFNYQLRKGQGDKVYANWGRYYGLDQKSSARALAPNRLYTETALFDLTTGALISKTPDANTTGKIIGPEIDPPLTDETVVGYATPLTDGWSLDAFFMYRHSRKFIEDAPTSLPNSGYEYHNEPFGFRKYRTLTVELKRVMRDRWAMNLSYAWSRLYGNYDQDYAGGLSGAAVFNTSALIDDGPGSFTSDRFRTGLLSQDRTHVYKILATWMPRWIANTSVGLYVRGQSGTPWEARGLPWGSTLTYLRYLEPAGTNRNVFWTNVDLDLKYGVKIDRKRTVRIEGRILNLFNQETPVRVDQRKYLDPRNRTLIGPLPTGNSPDVWSAYTDAMAQGTSQPNPKYGTPTNWAPPRRLLASLLFDF